MTSIGTELAATNLIAPYFGESTFIWATVIGIYTLSDSAKTFGKSGRVRLGISLDPNDLAQLLAMADLLDAIASGQWDGKQRTLKQTFDTLEKLEPNNVSPEGSRLRDRIWTEFKAA